MHSIGVYLYSMNKTCSICRCERSNTEILTLLCSVVETDLGDIFGTWGPSQSGGMPDPPFSPSGAVGRSLPELCPLPMGYPLAEDCALDISDTSQWHQ